MARPKKDELDKKSSRMTIRFTDDELDMIKAKAKDLNISTTEYIRNNAKNGKTIIKRTEDSSLEVKKKLAEEYHKIGINLNQIAHHLNSRSDVTAALLVDIEKCVSDLQKLRKEL